MSQPMATLHVGKEPKKTVDIIASGYEFECPKCGENNLLVAIPKYETAVGCWQCRARFAIGEVYHAQDLNGRKYAADRS